MSMKRPAWLLALVLGAVWGFLEGTWFFLVPDVLLSFVAIRSLRRAFEAAAGVVLGALVAACVLYGLLSLDRGTASAIQIERFWSALPGFRAGMMARASGYLESQGARGLLLGPGSGLPYRVFVLEAYRLGIPLSGILFWTPLARLERIVLAPIIVATTRAALRRIAGAWLPTCDARRCDRLLVILVSSYWVGLYGWYWFVFLPRTYGTN